MAKLNSNTLTITISEMVRDDEPTDLILDEEVLEQLLTVVQTLVGEKRLIEVNIK
jgi:hypothetical protein